MFVAFSHVSFIFSRLLVSRIAHILLQWIRRTVLFYFAAVICGPYLAGLHAHHVVPSGVQLFFYEDCSSSSSIHKLRPMYMDLLYTSYFTMLTMCFIENNKRIDWLMYWTACPLVCNLLVSLNVFNIGR